MDTDGTTDTIVLEGPGMLRELAGGQVEVDGVESLHQLVAEILGQISTQDAWAGRAPALEAPHACGACGHWQRVRVPFLHHACEACKALWVPGHCSRCGRIAASLASDFDGNAPPCNCGDSLQRLGIIPRQRPVGAPVAAPETLTFDKTTTRRAGLTVRLSAIAAGMVAVLAAVVIATGQGGPDVAPTRAPVSRPAPVAAAGSPAGRGAATGAKLRASGLPTTTFSCASVLDSSPGTTAVLTGVDRTAYLSACAN